MSLAEGITGVNAILVPTASMNIVVLTAISLDTVSSTARKLSLTKINLGPGMKEMTGETGTTAMIRIAGKKGTEKRNGDCRSSSSASSSASDLYSEKGKEKKSK